MEREQSVASIRAEEAGLARRLIEAVLAYLQPIAVFHNAADPALFFVVLTGAVGAAVLAPRPIGTTGIAALFFFLGVLAVFRLHRSRTPLLSVAVRPDGRILYLVVENRGATDDFQIQVWGLNALPDYLLSPRWGSYAPNAHDRVIELFVGQRATAVLAELEADQPRMIHGFVSEREAPLLDAIEERRKSGLRSVRCYSGHDSIDTIVSEDETFHLLFALLSRTRSPFIVDCEVGVDTQTDALTVVSLTRL
ncbi:MAG: hypothetical protein WC211_11785 [Dehalococcoidia bacterium]